VNVKRPNRLGMSRIFRVLSGGISRHAATRAILAASIFGVLVSAGLAVLPARPAVAATGINKQINFQGKVVNANGTNVANGSYSFVFSLYTVSSAGSNIWTETKSLTVTDGVFQTNLGSVTSLPGSVDFNTDNIYLGINFNSDGEMTPRIQFTAAAYAFNSDKLQGFTAAQFAQLSPGSAQSGNLNVSGTITAGAANSLTVGTASTNTGAVLFKGSGGGGTLTVQGPTTPNAGNFTLSLPAITANATVCTDNTLCTGYAAATGSTSYIQNSTTQQTNASLNIQAASTSSVTAQFQTLASATAAAVVIEAATGQTGWLLELQNTSGVRMGGFDAGGNVVTTGTLKTNDRNCASCNASDLTIRSGNGAGTTSNAGNISIDSGTSNGGTVGTITIAPTVTTAVTIGRSGLVVSLPGGLSTSGGNVNAGAGTITSGAVNGQTISSTASFTGTVTAVTSFLAPLHATADVASGTSGGITLRSGNATAGNGSTGNVTVDTGSKNGTGFNGNVYVGNTNALNVTIGHNAATASGTAVSIQGLAATSQIIMNDATNANATTIGFRTPTAANAIYFPNAGGDLCTTVASTCNTTYQPYLSTGYLAKGASDTSTASVGGNLYAFTNSQTGATGVLALSGAGTNSVLSVTNSGNAASGQAVILATNTNGAPTGSLIDLRVTAGSRFSVDTAGAVLTSSTINGQTITSSASFTGTVTSATGITATSGGITVTGTGTFNNAVNITGLTTTTGGITNNSAGIAAAGAISGATTVTASGTIQGGGTFKTADTTASGAVALTSGNASAGNSGAVSIDSGTASGTTGALTIAPTNSTSVTIGRTGTTAPTVAIQGGTGSSIQISNGATNYSLIQFTAPTAQVTYTLGTNASNTSANICTSLAASCNTTYQPYIASGYLVKSPTSNEASSSNFTGYQYTFTQSSGTAAGNLSLVNSGTNSSLLVTASSNPTSGQSLIAVNNTNGTPSGNLLDLQKAGTSQFAVDFGGNVSTLAGASTGKFNGQTISSTANFTGTVTSASALTVTAGGITVGGNSSITGTLGVSSTLTVSAGGASITGGINNNAGGITGAGAVSGLTSLQYNINGTLDTAAANSITIGGTNANAITIGKNTATQPTVSLQGGVGSVFTVTSGANATTLAFVNPTTAGKTVSIPNETGTICTNAASSNATCSNFAPSTAGTGYIQNQIAAVQSASNFWISATGRTDGSFLAPTFDTGTAATLNIGTSGAPTTTAISLNQNTTVVAGKSFTALGGLTQSGGAFSLAGNAPSSIVTTASNALTITSAAAATWSTGAGVLTVTGGGGTAINSAGTSGAASGAVSIKSGDVSSGVFSSGNLTVDVGASTAGTPGTISLGVTSATAIAIGHAGITTTTAGTAQIGTGVGTGALVNNGTTQNKVLAIADLNYTGSGNSGALGTAAATVDIYTAFTVNQSTASQTITIPTPTGAAGIVTGRVIYISNIGSVSFTLLTGGATMNPASTATLVYNGSAWTFAGADGNGILNQNSVDQAANFRVTGTGRANTSFTAPLFDSITAGALGFGTGAVAHTISIGTDATNVQGITMGSTNSGSSDTIQGGASKLSVANGGVTLQTTTNSTTAFLVQNAAGASIIRADTTDTNLVPNPGGEIAITASDWAAAGYTGAAATVTRTTSTAWNGLAAISTLTTTTANSGAQNNLGAALAISSTYTLSFYAKLSSGTFTDINAIYSRNGTTGAAEVACTNYSTQTIVTGGWTRVSCTIVTVATAGTSSAYIAIRQTAGGTARTFFLDGVQLELTNNIANTYGSGNLSFNATITSPVQMENTENSTQAFVIQSAAGSTRLLVADTLNDVIRIGNTASSGTQTYPTAAGSGSLFVSSIAEVAGTLYVGNASNGLSVSSASTNAFEPSLSGTARHTKNLALTAEFAGAVLDADGSSNTGTMTAAFEATNRFGYYKWVTSQGTAQDYDIVATVPVPDDFGAWTGTPTFWTYGSAGSSMSVTLTDTAGTVATNYNASALTVSTTWTSRSVATPAITGTYTQGSSMIIRIHMTAAATTGDVRLGTITLPYLTRW
jgi:hypothetical protein